MQYKKNTLRTKINFSDSKVLKEMEGNMAKNKYKEKNMAKPIEQHNTAAWSNISKMKSASKVNIPDETQVRNAKKYVDSNEK